MKNMGKIITSIIFVVVLISICAIGLVGCDLFGGGDGSSSRTPKSVKVTLDLNGGTGVTQLTVIGKPGEPMTLQSPRRQGFTFDKWYDGFDLIDNTVFPQKDILLTARYYCNEDFEESLTWTSELNKEYGGSSGYYYWTKKNFDAEKIEYITSNPNLSVNGCIDLEAYCSAAGIAQTFGAESYLKLTGANRKDSLRSVTVKNYSSYQPFTLSAQVSASTLVSGSGDALINIVYDTNLGSTYCYFRNMKVTLTFTTAAGTLV